MTATEEKALPKFLTLGQASEALSLPYETLRMWINAGKVEAQKFPRGKMTTYRLSRKTVLAMKRRLDQGLPA